MDIDETIDTQITLPVELYRAIARQAQIHGQSISNEIVNLLHLSFAPASAELEREFACWEAASDEDWLNMEKTIALERLDV